MKVVLNLKNKSILQSEICQPDHAGLVFHVVVYECPHNRIQHLELVELEGNVIREVDFADAVAVDAECEVLF